MNVKGAGSQPDPRTTENQARRRHLRRAAVAGALALALVLGLLGLEEGAEEVREARRTPAPGAPDAPAPSPQRGETPLAAAPRAEDLPDLSAPPAPAEAPFDAEDAPAPGGPDGPAGEAGPASGEPRSAAGEGPATRGTAPVTGEGPATGGAAPVTGEAGPVAADAGPTTAEAGSAGESPALEGVLTTAGGKHAIQLGVFSAADNAERLHSELTRQGFPVMVQSRVIVGPFGDRAAAESARDRLRETGALEGRVVPPGR